MSDQFTQPADVVRRSQLKTINSESLIGGGNIVIPAGETGPAGADGASAYEVAVANGFVGDETAWLASLVGADGADGQDGADGAPGATGATGAAGPNEVTTATSTNIDGILQGNGTNVAAVTIGSGLSFSAGTLSASGGGGNSFATIQPQVNGTNGTAVAADSTSDTLTINWRCGASVSGNADTDTLAVDAFGVISPHYAIDATVYDFGPQTAANTALALIANRKYLYPYHNGVRRTITEVALAVSLAAAGSSIRLGIRNRSATGEATTLVADLGTVNGGGTSGVRTITGLSVALNPGWYYLEIVSDGTPTMRAVTSTSHANPLGATVTIAVTNVNGLFRAFTFGALPSDETGQSQTLIAGGNVPIFGVR